nr:class I fructose-bisphosphate aldolase [Acidobacteriota bacterium]
MAITERASTSSADRIAQLLGNEADNLLAYTCKGFPKERLMLPGPDHVDRAWGASDRKPAVLINLQRLFGTGRLANTGYLSILPVDQGIEHSAAASFVPNPDYFDPENIVKLAIESGCNAVASTVGVLGSVCRRYAHKIPFIAKINHNELISYPNSFEQILFGQVEQAWEMGAAAVGATVYFGSEDSHREIVEISEAFYHAHQLGMATVLWAYLRNNAFKKDGVDYHLSADLTGQANHLAATMQADIVKQKQAENNGGYPALNFGKTDKRIYGQMVADHPIDWTRWQVVNSYLGRASLINSGGDSKGQN